MIPPSLLSVSGWFMAVPVWRLEPVVNAPPPAPPDVTSDAAAVGQAPAEPPLCSQKWVFQGIEWRPAFIWDCLPNPAWNQWVEARDDAALDRTRREDKLRRDAAQPLMPRPAGAEPPRPDGPAACPPDTQEG